MPADDVQIIFDGQSMDFASWMMIMKSVAADDGLRLVRLSVKYAEIELTYPAHNQFQALVDAYGRGEDIYQ